jgi:protein ImuA
MRSTTPSLEEVLRRHPVWRGGPALTAIPTIATGFAALDAELPGGGWPAGALIEILGRHEGIGELQLLLPALAALTSAGKRAVWLAPPHLPYAPALAAAGVDLANLAVVRSPGRHDALWAAEQALRTGSCHALLAWFRHARFQELRRLAVAAEASHALVALFRPAEAEHEASPAPLRIALQAAEGQLAVRIVKRRAAPAVVPLRLAVKRPFHALGRSSPPQLAPRVAREHRRLDLPVHA